MKNKPKIISVSVLVITVVIVSVYFKDSKKPQAEIDNTENVMTDREKIAAGGVLAIHLFLTDFEKIVGDEYEDLFAGMWLDFDDHTPHVGLTRIEASFIALAEKYNVQLVKHTYSYKELEELCNTIWDADEELYEGRLRTGGVVEDENIVELYIFKFEELRINNPAAAKNLEEDKRIIIVDMEEEEEGGWVCPEMCN